MFNYQILAKVEASQSNKEFNFSIHFVLPPISQFLPMNHVLSFGVSNLKNPFCKLIK